MEDNLGEELLENLAEIERQKNAYLIPENIREDVEILGVEGTLKVIDTSDATATRGDIIAPKTAYVNGEKVTGTIEVQQTVIGTGLNYIDATVDTNLTVFDVNLAYEVALLSNSGSTIMYMYEYKRHTLGAQLDSITVSSLGGVGNFLNMQIASQTNSIGNLNVYAYTRVTDGDGKICVVQFDLVTKKFSTTLKTSYSVAVPSDFYHVNQGCIAVNPVDGNVWALNNYARVAAGVPESGGYIGKYNPINNTFTNVQSWGQGSTGAGFRPAKQLSAEWDSTGRYLYVVTNKAYGRWRMIFYLNSTYTSYSTVYSAGNDNEYLCLWNGTYYFSNNSLKRLSDNTVVKTYDNLGMNNGTMFWTQQNTFFIVNFSLGTLKAYSINTTTLDLTKIWEFYLTSTSTANMALAGAAVCPISNHLSLYAETPQSNFKEFYSDTFVQTDTAKIGGSDLVNPIDATAKAGDILLGKTAYINTGKITGTMPNNGLLTYTPNDDTQTIPAGYTSGGIISPMDITTSGEYQTALSLSRRLLVGTNELYTELEYIEFTGTQYIDTLLIPTNHTTEVKFDFRTYDNDEHLFGTDRSATYYHFTPYNNIYYWGRNGTEASGGTWTTGIHTLVYNGDNYAVVLDGTTLGSGTPITSTGTLWIGRRDNAINLKCYVYYIKITDKATGDLIRDYIPVKRMIDDVICFYDKVTEEFFENLGTGTFVAGPEVEEE